MNTLLSILLIFITFLEHTAVPSALVEGAGKKLIATGEKKLFITIFEERQERLLTLKKVRASLQSSEREFSDGLTQALDQLKKQAGTTEQALMFDADNDYLKRKLELLLELIQALNDQKYTRAQLITILDEHIKVLQEYVNDPELKKFVKDRVGPEKPIYSFDDDLLRVYEMILAKEKEVTILSEQESNAAAELDNRKRTCQTTQEACQQAKDKKFEEGVGFTTRQKNDLQVLKERLLLEHKNLEALRFQEAENKVALAKTKLMIARQQLELLKMIFAKIKPLTQVNETDLILALDQIDLKKQTVFAIKDEYRQQTEKIALALKDKERELEMLSKRYNIPLGVDLDEWNKEPKRNVNSFMGFIQTASVNDDVLRLKRKKDLLEAQLTYEEEKLRNESLRIQVKDTFFKVINSRFITEDQINREFKKYDAPRTEIKVNYDLYQSRQHVMNALLANQKKALEHIAERRKKAEQERNTIFKEYPEEYAHYMQLLVEDQQKVQEQIDDIGKINATYTDIVSKLTTATKYIDFINAELGSISILSRPAHAISFEGIRNSISDIKLFIKDVKEYVQSLTFTTFKDHFKASFDSGWQCAFFFVKALILLGLLFLLRWYLPVITARLLAYTQIPMGIRWITILTAVILGFGVKHVVSLALWLLCFLFLMLYPIADPYFYILFYLFSIPYLIYLANRAMAYLVYFNETHNYVFLSKEYQDRFVVVASVVLYATIVLTFFREAFILGNYYKSEVPLILLTINFIIFQIGAILLLSRDQILSLIPLHSDFGKWLYDQVDNYYYLLQLFLIAIIVMSNPYVGYGRLAFYILKRLLYTAFLLQLLLWFNEWFKRVSSRVFFYFDVDEEVARNRFTYAKTWYGLFVVLMFGLITFIGLLIVARIWHWPDAFLKITSVHDVMGWVKTPFLLEHTQSAISLYTILKVIGFVFIGSLVAFIINRFVLGRVFDALFVDAGIQNTVSSLIRYLIIITAIILGFQSVGLGELVWYLTGALILGIGWVIKDPVADLVAYFIIVVQRPIKVGDFVSIDPETTGVVRRITPRSVELRRKNSTTVIVPNVQVTNKVLTNWNYARGFIAFDDILLTIPYSADPERVRELLIRVLAENRTILKNPHPVIRLESFSENGYVFMVRGFLSSNHILDMWDIASDVRFAIVKKLREQGIELMHPIRTIVSMNSMPSKE